MPFELTQFNKKWNKSLLKSKTVLQDKCRVAIDGTQLILVFKSMKTKMWGSAYVKKICDWLDENNIEYDTEEFIVADVPYNSLIINFNI